MNIVFMGTPDFAVPSLQRLFDDGYNIRCVITQPDKPKGRKQILTSPPIKCLALENNIEVFQPKTLKDNSAFEKIAELSPDLIIVVAYGKILPKSILDIPKMGCINVHGSLLPKYRGAAPIQHAILNGEITTGVTTMLMDEGLDTGDILYKSETTISENETSGELFDRLSFLGAELLAQTIMKLKTNQLNPIKQDDNKASYAPMLTREMSKIDWSFSALAIHNTIRGLFPWPIAETTLCGKKIKLHASSLTDKKSSGKPGLLHIEDSELFVACGDGKMLKISFLQPEGSKAMAASAYIRGHNNLSRYCFKN